MNPKRATKTREAGGALLSLIAKATTVAGKPRDNKQIKGVNQTPTPRTLIVARANSRYTPSTWLGGFDSTSGYGSVDGDSFGAGKSCFQPGAGLSSKGAVNSMMSSSGSL
ncbi:hypothetical protein RS3R6_21970 [Pseudomonas atacamensis]|uniref:Uncharacterized protein n=1 Tax=Pseudomonas atacamensis TaxID=2565368 RepID=A0ABQ5PGS4_9PSED|nr:hypothetical protein RS3R1_17730 [Pseudomonas atacamensis]GLH54015.1 hypothetical protein RS3R6_21970 [Pseudomonas atacamensis]